MDNRHLTLYVSVFSALLCIEVLSSARLTFQAQEPATAARVAAATAANKTTLPPWPRRDQVAEVAGDVMLGGLMMVHERDENFTCGKIMRQGGLQATEAMLFTLDKINEMQLIPGVTLGARIKDDCDRDIYGLEQSVEFIRGKLHISVTKTCTVYVPVDFSIDCVLL